MSRYYRVEIDLAGEGWTKEALARVEAFGVHNISVSGRVKHTIEGHISLCGGEDEHGAHDRLLQILGSINTRWLYLECRDWDVEIRNIPEENDDLQGG